MFYGRVIRLPGIPNSGRATTEQTVVPEKRINMREKTREMNDKGPKPDLRQFKVGDKVSLYDENSGIGRLQAL